MKNHQASFGSFLVLLSTLMFASYGVWSRLIGPSMGNFYQGWVRALLVLLVLVPIAYFRKEIVRIEKNDLGWLALFLLFTSFTQAPIFYAFNHMDIASASLLFFVSMFLTMNLVGVIFLNEKTSAVKIISSLLALAGMYLVYSFSVLSFALVAGAMAIVTGVASGGEVTFSKKLTGAYSPLSIVLLGWIIILLTNFVISIAIGEPQITPSISMSWFWQVCYSFVSIFGFWLVVAGVKHIDASVAALIGLSEIVFSIAFGIFIFHEPLTIKIAVGGMCIIIAAALPSIQNLFSKQKVRTV